MTDCFRPNPFKPEDDWMWGGDELRGKADIAVDLVRITLSSLYPDVKTEWFGLIGLDPRHLAIWIKTEFDAERDAILAEGKLTKLIQENLRRMDYPAEAIPHICGTAESQETVDRDWGGRWIDCMR